MGKDILYSTYHIHAFHPLTSDNNLQHNKLQMKRDKLMFINFFLKY